MSGPRDSGTLFPPHAWGLSDIHSVVRKINARVNGEGAKMMDADGRVWELCQILFADDTALVADSEEKLQKLVEEFGRVSKRRKL